MARFNPALTEAEVDAAFPGRFTSLTAVFAGGQGSIFRAERANGTVGALKIYAPDPTAALDERTAREVTALRSLAGPTIVTLDEDGDVQIRGQNCRFVCTTFIDGVSLSDRLANGALPVDAVARLGHDIADAIDALWEAPRRIVHRDIKPPNVMLAASGQAVLIDLGVARHTTLATLTAPNMAWGTLGHMSPEQASARKSLTCKSDVFSLGVMMQQALLGTHPYAGDQRRLINGGAPTSSLVNVPAQIGGLIDSMVRRDPSLRPLPDQIRAALLPHARALGGGW